MAGASIKIEYHHAQVKSAFQQTINALEDPAPLYQNIIEYLTRIHRERFNQQRSPEGSPWQPLAPAYLKRKRKNRNQILTLRGHLRNTLRGQSDAHGLEFGTDRPYGAIHQFGGTLRIPARQRELFFKRRRDGSVGNRFVKRKSSDFSQTVHSKAYDIQIPARPWLGTSQRDNDYILELTRFYIEKALMR